MANPEHLAKLKEGVGAWNKWRRENPEILPDLSGADLLVADLRSVDLTVADLRGVDLQAANLRGADLRHTDLEDANLRDTKLDDVRLVEAQLVGATLSGTSLHGADLSGANLMSAKVHTADLTAADLTSAILTEAEFWKANLSGANLGEAQFGETILTDLDMSECDGLDTAEHLWPSAMDHRTLMRSGSLPLEFLRGCGLPDQLIEYLPSLVGQAIQFYSLFLSHATKDREFVDRLHADLQDNGVRCYYSPEDLKIGDELRRTFDQAIRVRDKLLVVLSEVSLTRTWVKREVEQAIDEEERRREPMLFPIRLDNSIFDVAEGWATDLRRRHIGDFRNWKDHDAYKTAFERLLRDLKVEGPGEGSE